MTELGKMDVEQAQAEFKVAFAEHERLRGEVVKWMSDEAKALRLRQNSEAPMWPDYARALERKHAAGDSLGEALNRA